MSEYMIFTDSSCDLTDAMAKELGVEVAPLSVLIGEDTYQNFLDGREIAFKDFYARLRAGRMAKTSAVNTQSFLDAFTAQLQAGKDVLYLAFSSGLSATYQCAQVAAQALAEQFPERKIYVVDTLCASMGQGLLVYLAARKRLEGLSIDEVRDYAESIKLNLTHWFTVDDLHFLKRGGRISTATEIVGSMLSLKPVMHVDDAGHLIKMEVARGRKASIRRLFEKLQGSAMDIPNPSVFISHGDCLEDAEFLAGLIRGHLGSADIHINYVGPVIGAHAGPGTVALFYLGKER